LHAFADTNQVVSRYKPTTKNIKLNL